MTAPASTDARSLIEGGDTALGIELGSTRIKAVLVDGRGRTLASGGHGWENRLENGYWTYSLDEVVSGLQAAYRALAGDVHARYGVSLTRVGVLGISAMMHGYLAFDADWTLLTPFRTWRNSTAARASEELTDALGQHIPQRWSVAHLRQAVLDGEPHLASLAHLTTLSGYVHHLLTGRHVLGVGDAAGMFPIDAATHTYDERMLGAFDDLTAETSWRLADVLPHVLVAGQDAGSLTPEGARLLDPTGALLPGVPMCPPEGDAGTGMVATNAVAPRSGNVSAGTSIFAMVVLEGALTGVHHDLDLVTTPAGDPVAMVHANNCAGELSTWVSVLGDAARLLGADADEDRVYGALFGAALEADPDAGGLVAYNYQSGEHLVGLEEGRPLVMRGPGSRLTLANFMRANLYGAFATLALGMRTLTGLGVRIDVLQAHGGIFRTRGVAQRLLAAAVGVPVSVSETAGEGGAWGMALLAAYRRDGAGRSLADFLGDVAGGAGETTEPSAADVEGFAAFLERFERGLEVERAAVANLAARASD